MNIWLITVGEPLPTDGTNNRLLRTGILANLLVSKGHKVVWWTSTFDHKNKKERFNKDTTVDINDRYRIKLLHSVSYSNNISIRRVINHWWIAQKFNRLAESEPKPDIILCSLPTLELSLNAAEYGKKRGVPVVLDVRDLWPDIFLELVPVWGQWFLKLLLFPMFKTVNTACNRATAITGITQTFVDWGVNYANRISSNSDTDFPLGYNSETPSTESITEAERFWAKYGIKKDNDEFIACFFGTIGRQFELETVIEAARQIKTVNRSFRFVLCGTGDNFTYYKNLAKDCESIVFPGWVGEAEIWTLMRMSAVGLAPYRNIKNFTMNLPNKPIEYLSAGLPIVSGLSGVLKDLLSTYDCGVTYDSSNVNDLVSVLINLDDHRDRLKVMSKNASTLFKEKYVAENVYKDMINYLESISANNRNSLGGCNIAGLPSSN